MLCGVKEHCGSPQNPAGALIFIDSGTYKQLQEMPFFADFSVIKLHFNNLFELRYQNGNSALGTGGGTEFLPAIGFFTRVRKSKLFVVRGLTLALSVRHAYASEGRKAEDPFGA